jgi:hypothetical protein
MKKTLIALAVTLLVSADLSAAYTVVLKDGTRYQAKTKWTIVNGKAIINLQNGQTLQIDPALIDVAKSEQVTKQGLGGATVLGVQEQAQPSNAQKQPSLGDVVRARRPLQTPTPAPAVQPTSTAPADVVTPVANDLDRRLSDNFERAYENVGIYEHVMSGTNRVVRAEITADTEDRVFQAITATAFLMVRNAGVDGVSIDTVELFMKTTTGGNAGKFRMSRQDAEALNTRAMTPEEYFVRRVIY